MKERELIYGLHAVIALLEGGGEVQSLWMLDSRHDERLGLLQLRIEQIGNAAQHHAVDHQGHHEGCELGGNLGVHDRLLVCCVAVIEVFR